ncbi:hypothetical protein GCM10010965_26770 [Caldalkalibacillus thermarum]|nr:hypothetical protein GCM10010965_26770 [Caldalkalibacillus thermarum]
MVNVSDWYWLNLDRLYKVNWTIGKGGFLDGKSHDLSLPPMNIMPQSQGLAGRTRL